MPDRLRRGSDGNCPDRRPALPQSGVHEATTFPLAYYRAFFLERRYGLSLEPLGRWLRDHAKAAALGLVVGLAGAEIVYFALSLTPAWWWLVAPRFVVLRL